MRYFISGHRDITQKEFQRYYAKAITDAVLKEPNTVEFLVGDYYGVDEMAQAYVAKLKSTHPNIKMTVYHMFNTPRKNFYKFPTVGGFENDHTRDCAMTLNSDYDIAYKGDFYTFDDIETIRTKTNFTKNKGYGGIFTWSFDGN